MKKYIICFEIIVFTLLLTGCGKENKNENIVMYELKTSDYYDFIYNNSNSFYIDSEEELEKFYSLLSKDLNIDKKYLEDSTIFVQVKQVGSGSISIKLKDVSFDNNTINFSISENIPEVGTADMACWYLVAIVPNDMLQGINYDGWIKPSNINNFK